MSGNGFHVHGPHEHELEHAQQAGSSATGLVNQIAMFTAIIATVGAIFSYMAGATQANAGLYKNNASIKKTEASNQWNFFQAKSTKQALTELAMNLSNTDAKPAYQAKIERYEKEKNDIKQQAENLETQAIEWDQHSEEQMHQHHRWAQATTVLQVSIALAAIALLSKKKWLEYAMFATGGIGMAVGVIAMLHI